MTQKVTGSLDVAMTYLYHQGVTVSFVFGVIKFRTPKGHRIIRGYHDLLYDPKAHNDISGRFDLVYDPKLHRVIRGRCELLYDPKGHMIIEFGLN